MDTCGLCWGSYYDPIQAHMKHPRPLGSPEMLISGLPSSTPAWSPNSHPRARERLAAFVLLISSLWKGLNFLFLGGWRTELHIVSCPFVWSPASDLGGWVESLPDHNRKLGSIPEQIKETHGWTDRKSIDDEGCSSIAGITRKFAWRFMTLKQVLLTGLRTPLIVSLTGFM